MNRESYAAFSRPYSRTHLRQISIAALTLTLSFVVGCQTSTKTATELRSTPPASAAPAISPTTRPDTISDQPLESLQDVDPLAVISLTHPPLSLLYSKSKKMALMVSYQLTDEQLKARFIDRQKNPFAADPALQTLDPALAVGKKSFGAPYDRGHLAPAEDLSWSEEGFFASFYMSNMAPQKKSLNQRSWRRLEDDVREWACGEKKVTVMTGPILAKSPAYTRSGLEIPEAFFKIVVDETAPRKAAAFIYEQEAPPQTKAFQRQVTLAALSQRIRMKLSPRIAAYEELSPLRVTDLQTWKSIKCPEAKNRVKDSELMRKRNAPQRRLGQQQD